MSLYWKIVVWVNLIWLILSVIILLGNETFGWVHFIYGVLSLGTIIKCLELARDVELKDQEIGKLKSQK